VLREAELGVVVDRRRRREQHDHRARTHLGPRARDQFASDAELLVGVAHGEVGEVGDVRKIGQRPRDTDHPTPIPRGEDQVRVADHVGEDRAIVDGATLAQCRGAVKIEHFLEIELVAETVANDGQARSRATMDSIRGA
jgi:hypothetical protein